MTTTKSLSKIIQLPGAATEPVKQHPRRGRFPAKVAHITQAKNVAKLKNEVDECRDFFETCKDLYHSARYELLLAQQRAGMKVEL